MIIFAVDYGDVRTGMAVCDKGEILASPVGVLTQNWQPKLIEALKVKIAESRAQLVVVGLPVNMDGTKGERAQKCRDFAEALEAELDGIPVKLWDERLTTVSAHRALNEVNVRGAKRKAVVDAVSAVMILEDYLAARKNGRVE